MAYRKVETKIWNDEKFRDLSDRGKLVFFFLLTHPHMTPLGAMRATMAGLAAELDWTTEAFRDAFREGMSLGIWEANEKACFVALPKFLRYNPPESINVVKAWVKCLDLIPECEGKTRTMQRAVAIADGMSDGFRDAIPDAMREAIAKASRIQEQEQEQEQEQYPSSPGGGTGERLDTLEGGQADV